MSDKFARVLTGLAVLAVAVIAAIVSFTHIASVAAQHGYTDATAKLLPFSVDGLIVAASLVLLAEARAQRPAPRLARAGLWLGICATLAANVEHGAAFGPVGALVNSWPGVAFVIASETLLAMIRRAGDDPAREAVAETVAAPGDPFTTYTGAPALVPVHLPASVPMGVPADVPVDAPVITPVGVSTAGIPPVSARRVRTVAPKRASGRASKSPARVFAAEIEAGELPSIRAIKSRAKCGTPRATEIREHLAAILREAQPEAA